jgi:hypothetical protein
MGLFTKDVFLGEGVKKFVVCMGKEDERRKTSRGGAVAIGI